MRQKIGLKLPENSENRQPNAVLLLMSRRRTAMSYFALDSLIQIGYILVSASGRGWDDI
jgi:hypothetical protein